MRHILIIHLHSFYLSSFLTSCDKKEETLYRWETSSGIGLENDLEMKMTLYRVYKGEWKNEKPNGLGVMTYPDGHKYVGEWKDGIYIMVKEHQLTLMEGSMSGNSRMGRFDGQGTFNFTLMDKSM